MDAAADGAIVVADFTEPAVHLIGADGKVKWTRKSKGVGPGDVMRPYRVALGDSTAWVYDYAARDFSQFSRGGTFLRRVRTTVAMSHVDDIAAVGDSLVVVLGSTRHSGLEQAAIHVFDRNGVHRRSFGELPIAVDRAKIALSGAGTLAKSVRNTLLYTRKGPYQLLEYSAGGALLGTVAPPLVISSVVDSMVLIETNAEGRERISSRAKDIRFPVRAVPLSSGYVVSGISDRGTLRWWLHTPAGSRPLSIPAGLSVSTWHAATCSLIAIRNGGDDEPALVALDLRAELPKDIINPLRCKP